MFAGPHGRDPGDAVRLVGTVAAILSIGAGVIHVSAAGDHTNLPVMFAGFLVVAALQVALGALLLWRRPSKLLIAAGVGLMLGSVGMWVLSRTEGLPFLEGGHIEPVGFKDGITVLFELGSVPALLLLMSRDLARVSLPSPRLASHTLAMVGAGCFALMAPALLLDGGEHHSHEEAVALGIHEHEDAGPHEPEELAHADTESAHGHDDGDDHHAKRDEGPAHDDRHDDGGSTHQLASTLGASQEHGGADTHGDSTGGERTHGNDHDDHHQGGDHDDDSGKGHGDGGHGRGRGDGHGDHEDGEDDGSGDGEEPVSLTWVCQIASAVTDVCAP